MKKKSVVAGLVGIAVAFGAVMMTTPVVQAADETGGTNDAVPCPKGSLRYGETLPIAECNIHKDHKDDNLMNTVSTIITVAMSVIGVISVVMIILGGVSYATSQGDSGKTKKAKDTILYGVIGLIVVLLAYAIVNFVLKSVFSS